MSLPEGFTCPEEYFQECITFLQQYSWIYESSNTSFIQNNILDKFPPEWRDYFTAICPEDLIRFPSRKIATGISTLDQCITAIARLTPKQQQVNIMTRDRTFKKMSIKKQHEISRLSLLIKSICKDTIDVLLDFGSGLGYLSEILFTETAYRILGIESDPKRVEASQKRQRFFYPESKDRVFFTEHFVTNNSKAFILQNIKELFPDLINPTIAIVGLHACADLAINSMKLFLSTESIITLITMPCCYHKLELQENGFKNFPLSRVLKNVIRTNSAFKGFARPFLRLACQQTSVRWSKLTAVEMDRLGNEMFLRGAGEAILGNDEVIKKCVKNIQNYIIDYQYLCKIYELHQKSTKESIPWTSEHYDRFEVLVRKHPSGNKLASGLACLQNCIQELCENVVLYDRLCYLNEEAEERGLKLSVSFEKILNDELSPRCCALVAKKR